MFDEQAARMRELLDKNQYLESNLQKEKEKYSIAQQVAQKDID